MLFFDSNPKKFRTHERQMMFRFFLFFILFSTLCASSVWSHKPLLSVDENGDGTIYIEVGFSDGDSGTGHQVFLRDLNGKLLSEHKVPKESYLEIVQPNIPYTVTFAAGGSHFVTKTGTVLKSGSLPSIQKEAPPATVSLSPVLILTGLPATYFISTKLTQNTSFQVRSVFPAGIRMDDQISFLQEQELQLRPLFEQASIIISISKAWASDPLYGYSRRTNPRLVEIDASFPFDPMQAGVALAKRPINVLGKKNNSSVIKSQSSAYIWLSLVNVAKMAEIIAGDLQKWKPEDKKILQRNLATLKQDLFQLQAEFDQKFLEIEKLETITLAEEFIYLFLSTDIALQAYLGKEELRWNTLDFQQLQGQLQTTEVPVVVHKWLPNTKIIQLIQKHGAHLVPLETMEAMPPQSSEFNFLTIMRDNLQALHLAFLQTQ